MRNLVQIFENDIFQAADLSTNLTSDPVAIVNYPLARAIYNFSIQPIYSGTSVDFYLYVDASMDGVNWVAIPDATLHVLDDTGSCMLNFFDQAYKWIRVRTTAAGGTGTLTVKFQGVSRYI